MLVLSIMSASEHIDKEGHGAVRKSALDLGDVSEDSRLETIATEDLEVVAVRPLAGGAVAVVGVALDGQVFAGEPVKVVQAHHCRHVGQLARVVGRLARRRVVAQGGRAQRSFGRAATPREKATQGFLDSRVGLIEKGAGGKGRARQGQEESLGVHVNEGGGAQGAQGAPRRRACWCYKDDQQVALTRQLPCLQISGQIQPVSQ